MTAQTLNPNQIFSGTFLHQLSSSPFPNLDIKQREGYSGYIDFIDSSEFNSAIVQGVDCNNRPFVCLKIKCTLDDGNFIPCYQTFFQRYTNSYHLWMGTSNTSSLIDTIGGMTEFQKDLIYNLIQNKSVDISQENYNYYKFSFELFQNWENMQRKEEDKFTHKKIVKIELDENIDLSQDARLVLVGYNGDKA